MQPGFAVAEVIESGQSVIGPEVKFEHMLVYRYKAQTRSEFHKVCIWILEH